MCSQSNLTHLFRAQLLKYFPTSVNLRFSSNNELTIIVSSNKVFELLQFLKFNQICQFKCLTEICGVDYPFRKNRFEVVYCLLSLQFNTRLRVKTMVSETSSLESATSLFSSANWLEREVWDLFGIYFKNHPDLRRILTDYGFSGHPFRKDFPLGGYQELRYDELRKSVVIEQVQFRQEFRSFNFESSWDDRGQTNYLSLDSKRRKVK